MSSQAKACGYHNHHFWVAATFRLRFFEIPRPKNLSNKELNELINNWEVDHIYKHNPIAIEAFWFTIMLAYNLFHAFINPASYILYLASCISKQKKI